MIGGGKWRTQHKLLNGSYTNFVSKNKKHSSEDTSKPNPKNLELISNIKSLLKVRSYLIASKIMFIGGANSKSESGVKSFLIPVQISRLKALVFSKSQDVLVILTPIPARLLNHVEAWTTKRSKFSLIANLARICGHREDWISGKFGISAIVGKAITVECEPEDLGTEDSCSSPISAKAMNVPVKRVYCEVQDVIGRMLVIPIEQVLFMDAHNSDHVANLKTAKYERFPTIEAMGTDDSLSDYYSTFRLYYDLEKLNSRAKSTSSYKSNLIGKSDSTLNAITAELQTNKETKMMVYRPPILKDGILYIPSASSATLGLFGTLEVI